MTKLVGNFKDLTNKVFGNLTVIERVENAAAGQPTWLCRCSCDGKTTKVRGGDLRGGRSQSCGRCIRDLTMQKFGRLLVLMPYGRNARTPWKKPQHGRQTGGGCGMQWLCVCECGNTAVVLSSCLLSGSTTSCGCWAKEVHASRAHLHPLRLRHGHSLRGKMSSTYTSWSAMLSRTVGKGHEERKPTYIGVNVCPQWNPVAGGSFENFLVDNGKRPDGCTFGRLGDTGDYEPGNAFWQTDAEQKAQAKIKRFAKTEVAV